MKKYSIFVIASLLLISCSGNGDGGTHENENLITDAGLEYPEGKDVYFKTCVACHQDKGQGLSGTFPPLAKSDYLLDDVDRAIEQVLYGSSVEMTVNGESYTGIMPPQVLSDQEVMDVMNYVLNSWGNNGGEVSLEQVENARHPE